MKTLINGPSYSSQMLKPPTCSKDLRHTDWQTKFVRGAGVGRGSGESTRIPPIWPGFNSRSQRHMWVEFVVGSLFSLISFSPRTLVFPSPQNQHCQIPIRFTMHGHMLNNLLSALKVFKAVKTSGNDLIDPLLISDIKCSSDFFWRHSIKLERGWKQSANVFEI